MLRPLIGITTRLDIAQNTFYLRRFYGEAVSAFGGVPVYIPLIPEEDYLGALSEKLDGLLLSGSNSDLDPAYFNEEPQRGLGHVIAERDKTDLILLKLAEVRELPVLGICFGAQSLAVSRGGSLIQDLASENPQVLKHDQGEPYDRPSHSIQIESGSLLERLAGSKSARVNTSHHQAIRTPGRDLCISARSMDGVVECIEDTRPGRYVLGTQWHPELGWQTDQLSRAIFESFVNEAARRMS